MELIIDKGSVDLCQVPAITWSVGAVLLDHCSNLAMEVFLTRSRFAAAVQSVLRQVGPCCSYVCVSILGIALELVLSCVGYTGFPD